MSELKLQECGFDKMKAISVLRERKVLFDAVVQDWNKQNTQFNDEWSLNQSGVENSNSKSMPRAEEQKMWSWKSA